MSGTNPAGITPGELKKYISCHHESDYLLVDVRQPDEYENGHIPGAKSIPVLDFVSSLYEQPTDKDLIFYCRSGGRSAAAAVLTAEEKITAKNIYNLNGGIMSWEDRVLSDFPKISIFKQAENAQQLLWTAMDLEKGAQKFYDHVSKRFTDQPVAEVFSILAMAEEAHARMIYDFWERTSSDPRSFKQVFEDMNGNIIEGGGDIDDFLRQIVTIKSDVCMNLIEMGLLIEYSAFDLYKTMAGNSEDGTAENAFLSIAQAEKAHMQTLLTQIEQCS